MTKINWKALIVSVAIPLAVGGLSAFLTNDSMESYEVLKKPPISPPSIVFPIVWTILFVLMGISAYIVYTSNSKLKKPALKIYAVQLIVNFFWTLIFFNEGAFLFAFIWLVLLWLLVLWMIILFWRVKPVAGILQIPYLLWLTFAGYLNLAIYILNR